MKRYGISRGLVLDQRARQCVLESLVHAEKLNLQRLTAMVGEAAREGAAKARMLAAERGAMDRLRDMESERRREVIREDDRVFRTLVAVIAGRGKF